MVSTITMTTAIASNHNAKISISTISSTIITRTPITTIAYSTSQHTCTTTTTILVLLRLLTTTVTTINTAHRI